VTVSEELLSRHQHGGIKQCCHRPSVSLSLCLRDAPSSKTVRLWLGVIGNPMLQVEPTDQCGRNVLLS